MFVDLRRRGPFFCLSFFFPVSFVPSPRPSFLPFYGLFLLCRGCSQPETGRLFFVVSMTGRAVSPGSGPSVVRRESVCCLFRAEEAQSFSSERETVFRSMFFRVPSGRTAAFLYLFKLMPGARYGEG